MDRREIRLIFVDEAKVETHADIVFELKKRYEYQKISDMTYEWKKNLLMDIYTEELQLLDAMKDCHTIEVEDPDARRKLNMAFESLDKIIEILFDLERKVRN